MPNSTEEGGGSSGGNHSGSGSSRKEKKKQAKEERDRLKQAEKKKRRLEKALATAAAIRSELEKKKQRRKEEEQRLDEEGAKLAEAVALQVLVDEESDGVASPSSGKVDQDEMYSLESNESVVGETTGSGFQKREVSAFTGQRVSGNSASTDYPRRVTNDRERGWTCEWDSPMVGPQNEDELANRKGLISSAEEKARVSTERARAAEMAAGLAAAQAVAALRIAEEARAEAEAAKKAAEAAMIEALDQRDTQHRRDLDMSAMQEPEEDKNDLKARLIETERKLMEKTRRVSELEQNLDEVTQYLLEFKAKFESCKGDDKAIRLGGGSEGVTSQVGQ